MKVVGLPKLASFADHHADARMAIQAWVAEAQEATWKTPADLKARYPSASILGDSGVIFNLKGTHYRLQVSIHYSSQLIVVKRMGTHAEYSKWKC
ncbi:MAG: type II toxin-antitoxin system HigB family toxin [Opitutaceae bacterium]|nr:type II toxin-antitoxin system HigB family toxin [Opitutaceae bacterium]